MPQLYYKMGLLGTEKPPEKEGLLPHENAGYSG
jgi:hypothetical protein